MAARVPRADAGAWTETRESVRPAGDGRAVELQGVAKRYADVAAVRGVSLTIREGEFFSLLGPSGCGKTTTLNLIGGFLEPDEGEVVIQGRAMTGIPPHRRPVNTVFQSYALFPHMSVAENIAFGLKMKRMSAAEIAGRVGRMLELTSLVGLGDRRPAQLSGGQQQRVALARALVNQPAVLLLDEPLGSLDLKLRKQMQLELSRIQREVGITFVYVTHDQEEAMTMSDRIAVMDRGAIAQVGSPQAIYERPASRFVADFIGASNVLPGRIRTAQAGLVVVRLQSGDEVRVPDAGGLAEGAPVSVVVRPDRLEVRSGTPGESMNALAGRVTKVSYLGTYWQIVLVGSGGLGVTVHHRTGPGETGALPTVGDTVYAVWLPAHALCFPES
jgi:spermidine/putrescine transport system ATP-binding protein